MNLLWNSCVVHRRRKFCWNTISAYFSYFGMIKPDIDLPKSPGTGAGRPVAPAGRWLCGAMEKSRTGLRHQLRWWTSGSQVLWFPCGTAVRSASGTTNQYQKWNDPNIWRRVLVQLIGSEPCLGGVDIFLCKACHSRGSFPIHPLRRIARTVSLMHMHRYVREQRTSETKQGMGPVATNTDCRLWTSIIPEYHHKFLCKMLFSYAPSQF